MAILTHYNIGIMTIQKDITEMTKMKALPHFGWRYINMA